MSGSKPSSKIIKLANVFSSGHPSDLDISLANEVMRSRQFIMCEEGVFFSVLYHRTAVILLVCLMIRLLLLLDYNN